MSLFARLTLLHPGGTITVTAHAALKLRAAGEGGEQGMAVEAGRVMALDVGERTIGIALSDPERRIASPFTTIRRTSLPADLAALEKMIADQEVAEIVVGMPRSLSGDLGFQAEQTGRFVDELRAVVQTPVTTWDERFSTAEADRALIAGQLSRSRRKQIIDRTAAALILQGYLAHQQEMARKL